MIVAPPPSLRRRRATRREESPPAFAKERDDAPRILQASEGGVATAEATAARPLSTSLAALLTRHILRDGEVVLLILKPSLWFIALAAMRFSAVVLIGVIAAKLWRDGPLAIRAAEVGVFLIVARVMVAVLQWMGRLYVLTDLRVLRLSGVFSVDIFDCPLRKVAETKLHRTFRERVLQLGSIEMVPAGDSGPAGDWRTIKRPADVQATIDATVRRAKQNCI